MPIQTFFLSSILGCIFWPQIAPFGGWGLFSFAIAIIFSIFTLVNFTIMVLALSAQTATDMLALREFLTLNPSIKAEEIAMADMYGEDGQFKEINLALPTLPLSKAYMNWFINKAKQSISEGKGMSLDEAKAAMQRKRAAYFANR